jgi:hypothetical protein
MHFHLNEKRKEKVFSEASYIQYAKKQVSEVCHVWRNNRLIFYITAADTFGEFSVLTP